MIKGGACACSRRTLGWRRSLPGRQLLPAMTAESSMRRAHLPKSLSGAVHNALACVQVPSAGPLQGLWGGLGGLRAGLSWLLAPAATSQLQAMLLGVGWDSSPQLVWVAMQSPLTSVPGCSEGLVGPGCIGWIRYHQAEHLLVGHWVMEAAERHEPDRLAQGSA